ncbi:hypothetical protein BJY01DRAFT_134238 [Aspergillus pseudoustus]|uniref:Integral membrane protein n=1 Tax=Aspergillus pseudoustus TaxID=1810923 RepID=A0ABR4KDC4_9EURO
MPVSQHPLVHYAAVASGAIAILFGFNALFRPEHAMTFFEFDYPTAPAEKSVMDKIMYVYGTRDILLGMSCIIAGVAGNRKTLGWTMLNLSAMAWVDGIICWNNGHGQWNHWGYAPQLTLVGALLLGWFDRN